jgi:hypothetical protein
MLGSTNHPCLHAKAKEAHGLLAFAHELLSMYDFSFLDDAQQLRHKLLKQSGKFALEFDTIVQTAERCIDEATQRRMLNAFLLHCSMLERSGSDC